MCIMIFAMVYIILLCFVKKKVIFAILQYQPEVCHKAMLIVYLYNIMVRIQYRMWMSHMRKTCIIKNLQLPSFKTVEFFDHFSDGQAVIHICMWCEFSDTWLRSLLSVSEKNMKYPVTWTEDIFAG